MIAIIKKLLGLIEPKRIKLLGSYMEHLKNSKARYHNERK